jgi:TolB protein
VRAVRRDVEGALNFVVGWTATNRVVIDRRVVGLYPHDLWAMGTDGSRLRRLTTQGTAPLGAKSSPDGSQIAFWRDIPATRKRPEMLNVYVMPASGGVARRIVGGPRGAYASHPDWAPDGKRLVFARWPDGDHQDLFTGASNGGSFRRVTATGHAYAPAWSPDGRTIVFSDDGQLTAISPNGGQLRRLGETPLQYCSGADWSPDAGRIAAVCNSQLVVLEADGSGLRVLAPDAESAPSWSPDGNWIVYQSGTKLKMVGADSGAPPSAIDLYGAEARDPDWSPRTNSRSSIRR